MLQAAQLRPYPKDALLLRELVDEVIRTKSPIDYSVQRPKELKPLTLVMLVRDEWQTMEESIECCIPLATELIIGVDKETDSELSFAYREAFLAKGDKAREFFDTFMKLDEPRRATIAEIAEFMKIPEKFLQKRINTYLKDGKPTYRIAQKCIDKVGKGKIVEVDFSNHFSNARNQLLPHCTGEYCFFVDGHEFLSDVEPLMKALVIAEREHPGFLRFGILIDMADSSVRERNRQTRIWRNVPNARFNRGIHNQLVFDGVDCSETIEPTIDGCSLVHKRPSWLAVFRETQRRQMIIEYMVDKEDTSSLYYTGLSHQRSGNFEIAIKCFDEYLAKSPRGSESSMVCWYVGRCYEFGLKDTENALKYYYKGIEKCPDAAFCHLSIAMVKMKEEDEVEGKGDKAKLIQEALAHCCFAESCTHPGGTIAIPTMSYTWDAKLKKAECLRRLERYGECAQSIEEALQYEMEPGFKQQSEIALMEMRDLNFKKVDGELRLSKLTDKKYVYIIDRNQSTGRDAYGIAQGMGFQVFATNDLEMRTFFKADVIWVEHAGESAYNVSRVVHGDRKCIVRVYPEDLFSGYFSQIKFDKFDKVIVTDRKLIKYIQSDNVVYAPTITGIYEQTLPRVKDDVVCYIPLGKEYLLNMIYELGFILSERTINVFGYIRDQVIYEQFVSKCTENGVTNINLMWQVHPEESQSMLDYGGIYVSFSDEVDENIPIAIGIGRNVITTNVECIYPATYCSSIRDTVSTILSGDYTEECTGDMGNEEIVGEIINAIG